MHEMRKTAFSENAMGRTQTVVFHDSNVGNSVEDGEIQINPMRVAEKKMWRKFAKSSTKTGKIALWRSVTGYISPMGHASEV